ncbi:MAG: hypothetical protein ACYCV7_16790, partial [Acidimicrobiales bacterium]
QRLVVTAAALVVASVTLSVARPALAYADATSSASGGTISVGASSSAGSGGSPGASTTGNVPPAPGSGGTAPVCVSTPLTLVDSLGPPAGVTGPGGWYTMTCTSAGVSTTVNGWVSNAPAPSAVPAVSPHAVALQAENSLQLPSPSVHFDPPAFSVVNVRTWVWLSPAMWHAYTVSASAGSVTATATATPVSSVWNFGDGTTLTCAGPGTPYRTDLPASGQRTSCAHTYAVSSMGQPSPDGNPNDAAFRVTATVTWLVSWTAQGAPGGGSLPSLTTVSSANLRVEQVESVNS